MAYKMILFEDAPEMSLYVLGAKFISVWRQQDYAEWRVMDAYESISKDEGVSFGVFMLTLDWLFLIKLLEHTADGRLKKCF